MKQFEAIVVVPRMYPFKTKLKPNYKIGSNPDIMLNKSGDIAYQSVPTTITIIKSITTLFFSNLIASLLILVIALGIKSFTSFSTFETLYGVVIGFFTGVYIPIGYYPTIIRNIFFYFPLCQTTSILRNIQTSSVVDSILENLLYTHIVLLSK